MMLPSRQFRHRFTPIALLCFVVAFLTSAALLLTRVGEQRWAFTYPLLAYGLVLVVAQRRFEVALSGTLKDSPYFLGFLLTLVALAAVFLSFGDALKLDQAAQVVATNGLVQRVGGALGTTIIGLAFRQLLLMLDPGETTRDAVFQSVMDSIRRNAGDFATAQHRLVDLITDFSSARESTLTAELTAHERHLRALEHLSSRLETTEKEWAVRFNGFDAAVGRASEQLLHVTTVVSASLATARVEIDSGVATIRSAWQKRAAEDQSGLADAAASLRASAAAVSEAMRTSAESITVSASAWEQIGRLIPGEAARVAVESERIREDAQLLGRALAELRAEASTLRQALASAASGLTSVSRQIGDESGAAVRALHDSFRQPHEAIRTGLADLTTEISSLSGEVRQIDGVVSQVVQLLEERMKALERDS